MGKQWEMKWTKNYLPPNTLLKDKYRISAVLGMGSFGITYLGVDTLLEQNVAVKEFFPSKISMRDRQGQNVTVLPDYLEEFEKGKVTFKKEAERIFGLFDIPGICVVKDYFEENETAYIVEEYLAGGTLKDYLTEQNGKMISWRECREMFEPVMEGLCHIHAMGIVHRDISPDNLMFTGDGELKLIDFGAATVKEAADETVILKEGYAPPEQYKDTDMIGPWSDIFAVCAVMYQTLTGNKPVPSLQRIGKDSLSKISNYTDIPQREEEAVLQGLSLDIPKRYFYIGNLMDRLGMDVSKVQNLIGKNRAVWGEIWLKIITENNTELQKSRKKRLSFKQKKGILTFGAAAAVMVLLFVGGLKLYIITHEEEVLKYEAQKIREENEEAAKTKGLITDTEDAAEYEEMLDALEPYETTVEGTEEGDHDYEVPKDVLKKLGLCSNGYMGYGKFCLDVECVEKILEFYYDQKLTVTSEYYNGTVTARETGGRREMESRAYGSVSYSTKNTEGEEIYISIEYDPVDELVSQIYIKGDIEDGRFFLEKIFPYFVPETYFMTEEIETLFASSTEAFSKQETLSGDEHLSEDVYVSNHAKFNLTVSTMVGADYKYVNLRLKSSGYYW
ncbi:MAG: serine/threonine protein kinase [Ruminococcus sp.]|nr:serine/threonine protein kinase [Ruminococcus sp.]